MLVYKATQVIGIVKNDPKPWEIGGRSGITHSAKMAVVGADMGVSSITLKAKTAEELETKIKKYPLGKPADIAVTEIVPVFKAGDRRAANYELAA